MFYLEFSLIYLHVMKQTCNFFMLADIIPHDLALVINHCLLDGSVETVVSFGLFKSKKFS